MAGEFSANGDDLPDLAIAFEDADIRLFADPDADGTIDLIVGHNDFGRDPTGAGPGLIAVFDLSGW